MEKWIIGILCMFLLLGACGAQEAKESFEGQTADAAKEGTKDAINTAMQGDINLKCTMGTAFTISFLGDEAMVASATTKSWIKDNYVYGLIKVGNTQYLMKSEVSPTEMNYMTMKELYYQSKAVQGFDCVEGAVTEEDMTLPNLPQLSPEEFNQKFQEEMMKGYK